MTIQTLQQLLVEKIHLKKDLSRSKLTLRKQGISIYTRKPMPGNLTLQRFRQLSSQIESKSAQIAELIKSDEQLQHKYQIIRSFPGIGEQTAEALLIQLPELGECSSRQLYKLLGIAPHSSHTTKHYRQYVRTRLYLAMEQILKYNIVLDQYYSCLTCDRPELDGKTVTKICMRKVIQLLNALVKANSSWHAWLFCSGQLGELP